MIARLWQRMWFEPEPARNLRACRFILAAQALWLLLSRPDIPDLVTWPSMFFPQRTRLELLRYGIVRGHERIEWLLYLLLHLTLVAVLFGLLPRITTAVSGLLLYHFAPFEEIIVGMPHTHFGGLTVSTLGLLILSFAEVPPRRSVAKSAEYRWPVALIQLLFAFTYLFAFFGKLRYSGFRWFTAQTIHVFVLANWGITHAVLARQIADRPILCWAIALFAFFFESTFWICVFLPRARWVYVPLAIAFHVATVLVFDINFPSFALLLLFVNWDWVAERARQIRERTPLYAAARNRRVASEN
jgi:Vitamin K-dependent gamma-carboxylase